MIPNPILKVLSTLFSHEVRHLLMGGQACVFYGAAEFSRDCDIAVLSDEQNFAKLSKATAFPALRLGRKGAVRDAKLSRIPSLRRTEGLDQPRPTWWRAYIACW